MEIRNLCTTVHKFWANLTRTVRKKSRFLTQTLRSCFGPETAATEECDSEGATEVRHGGLHLRGWVDVDGALSEMEIGEALGHANRPQGDAPPVRSGGVQFDQQV